VAARNKRRVTGIRVRSDGGAEDVIDADLIVDTTGRASRAPVWLEELGYARPVAEKVTVDVAYATRSYRLPPDILGTDQLIMNFWTPEHPRAAGLEKTHDRFLLTAAGLLGDHPPTDPKGFDKFVASLRFPDIPEAIRAGEPLDDPVASRYPANVRQRYERMRDFPRGLPRSRRRGVRLQPDLRPGHDICLAPGDRAARATGRRAAAHLAPALPGDGQGGR
jgi:hypothetical protein